MRPEHAIFKDYPFLKEAAGLFGYEEYPFHIESTTKTSQYFEKHNSYSEETYHYYDKIKLLVILKSPATTIGKVNLLFRIVRPTLLERGNLYPELSGRHYLNGVFIKSRTVRLPLMEK